MPELLTAEEMLSSMASRPWAILPRELKIIARDALNGRLVESEANRATFAAATSARAARKP